MDYSGLVSGLFGTVIGGIITWMITRNSLKKQFEYQQKLIELKEKQKIFIAFKSIQNEIIHNLIQLSVFGIIKIQNAAVKNTEFGKEERII